MRVAGIDCGTNSIRLLIADVPGVSGALDDVVRSMEVVRLGQGVDKTGKFDDVALTRTFAVVEEYAALCATHGVTSIRFAATSATRDAENRQIFIDGVRERLGVTPQVLSGEEEAHASFSGAISVLSNQPSPILAIDLGGGSTELVLGDAAGNVMQAFSMNVGCVRMRERHFGDEPSAEQIAAARSDVRAALDEAEGHVDLSLPRTVIGLAGSVTTITALALNLSEYDPQRIHGAELSLDQVNDACNWLIEASPAERAALGFMHPGRVDVIGAGALVWQEVIARIAQRRAAASNPLNTVITSEHDILDGIALWAGRDPQSVKF